MALDYAYSVYALRPLDEDPIPLARANIDRALAVVEYLEPTFKTLDEYRENFQGFVFQELKDSEAETYIAFGSLPVSNVWNLLTDLLDNDGIFDHT